MLNATLLVLQPSARMSFVRLDLQYVIIIGRICVRVCVYLVAGRRTPEGLVQREAKLTAPRPSSQPNVVRTDGESEELFYDTRYVSHTHARSEAISAMLNWIAAVGNV